MGALAFASALAFGRVFSGRSPTVRLIVAGLLAVALGWATARRGLFVATSAGLVGLALALAWFVFPQTSWYGLPTVRTLRAVARSLEYVGQQTRTQISPAPALPPLMMAAVTAIWAASSSAYTLVARAGSPILAVLPAVALVAFADIVLEDGVRPLYAALFLLAALAVVFTDGLRRIRQWGPVWAGPYRDHTLRSTTGRGVRRVGLVALGAALLVPSLLPGFRSPPLVDLAAVGGTATRLDPFVSIHASLNRDEPIDLFRVSTSGEASYWRLFALDEFDGSTWQMSDPNLEGAQLYPTPARLPTAFPPDAEPLEQRFEMLTDLGDRFVPLAYPAEVVDLPAAGVRYDAGLGIAQAPEPLEAGQVYSVTSRRVLPTPEQLDAVRFDAPAAYGQYTFLPGDVPPEVAEIARGWTRGEPTPYRQVLAIQERFHDGAFAYSQDVEPEASADAIVEFLSVSKTGFCQQFSTAMAVLVRELGYPARVAVGFQPGVAGGRDDTYTVSTEHAHTWVEVLFPGYGWLPFEPTPGRALPLAEPGTYANPVAPAEDGTQEGAEGGGAAGDGGLEGFVGGLPPKIAGFERNEARRGGGIDLPGVTPAPSAPAPDEPGYAIPYRLLLGAALVALAALLVLVPLVKWTLRYRALHRRRPPREAILAAYRVFDGEAADLGLGREPGETLLEHRERIGRTVRCSDGHLERLTAAAIRAAYSDEPPDDDEASGAIVAARSAIQDMRRDAGPVRRLTGVYRPGW